MKIYHKKLFASGAFIMALGVVNLVMSIMQKDVDINTMIPVIALFAFGLSSITRSLSRKKTQEDKLDKLDERNVLIELKSKSKSFQLTQTICFVLMLIFLVIGKVSSDAGFIAMGVGLAFVFTISMLTEIFTYMYYESKN